MNRATPGKARGQSRYSTRTSMSSEYDSAVDDSDSSLYYSMAEDSDGALDKENSRDWTVTETVPTFEMRSAKKATPLLRKILQPSATPRNKNNKRVSFSDSPKPMPSGEKIGKGYPKTPRRSKANGDDDGPADIDGEVANCQAKFAALMTIDESAVAAPPENATTRIEVAAPATMPDSEPIEAVANGCVDSVDMPANQLFDCFGTNSDGASDGGLDDRDHSMLENTIIEKSARLSDSSLQGTPTNDKPLTPIVETPDQVGGNANEATPTNVAAAAAPAPGKIKEHIKSAITSVVASLTPSNAKSASAILEEFKRRSTHIPTNNPTRQARTQLANETRKSIAPKATSRQTSFRRRSSTYEPRKVDARKTINVLKKVRKTLSKADTGEKKVEKLPTSVEENPTTSNNTGVKAEAAKPQPNVANGETKTNIRKPRYTIMGSSRPTLTTAQRMQRRETVVHSKIPSKAQTSAETTKDAATKVRPSMARPPMARQSVARPSMARSSIARPSTAPSSSSAAQSTARPPMAHPPVAPQPTARPSVAHTSMAPPSSLPTRSIARPKTTASSAPVATTASTNPPAANHRTQQQSKPPQSKPSRKTIAPPPKPPSNGPQSQCNEPSKCTYCDKTFVKGLAFKQHLLNNCEKIPATQRRLLQDTRPASSNNVTNGAAAAAAVAAGAHRSDTGLGELAANMKRMPNTFSGVTRTPSKSIKCHVCRRAFLNCAEYAMHVVQHQYERQAAGY